MVLGGANLPPAELASSHGEWSATLAYPSGSVAYDPTTLNWYTSFVDVAAGNSSPSTNPGQWEFLSEGRPAVPPTPTPSYPSYIVSGNAPSPISPAPLAAGTTQYISIAQISLGAPTTKGVFGSVYITITGAQSSPLGTAQPVSIFISDNLDSAASTGLFQSTFSLLATIPATPGGWTAEGPLTFVWPNNAGATQSAFYIVMEAVVPAGQTGSVDGITSRVWSQFTIADSSVYI
jgi:hypothetical protein